MENLQELVQTVTDRVEKFDARSAAARAARDERLKKNVTLNKDLEPIYSDAGIHAPCDNYHWVWNLYDTLGDLYDICENTFMAGEFLPWDKKIKLFCSNYADKRNDSPVRRATYISVDRANAVIDALSDVVEIYAGAAFEGRNGDQVVYVYIDERCKDVADAVEAYLDAPKVAAAAAAKAAQEAERDAADPCPTGRVVITGEVLSTKLQESYYGSTWKMLVKDDRGFKVWGSIPSSLDASRGCRVTFTAAIEPSNDDDKFGFYKRPTKAEILEVAA